MATRRLRRQAYGMDSSLIDMAPEPIVAVRDPSTSDFAEIGTLWVNTADNSVWCLTSITSNSANWSTSPASGVGIFSEVQITTGDLEVDQGDVNITLGNLNVDAGNTTLAGDLSVSGTVTITGDIDFTSAALIDLTSTANLDPSILLRTNGGATETLQLTVSQGTSVDSLDIQSVSGGITLNAGLASDDAFNIESSGGVDINAAMQINIASSENTADSIVINSSAGGMDILAAGAAGEDIDIVNTAGSININSGEVIATSMVVTSAGGLDFAVAGTGGLDVDMVNTAGSINITAGEAAAADAIVINASAADSGVQIQAGSPGILVGNQADCAVIDLGDIVPTSARTITVAGGTVATAISDTVDIGPDGVDTDAGASKVVNINSGNITLGTGTTNIASGNRVSGTHTANISTGTGTKTVSLGNADGLTTFNVDAITLINDSINVDTSINTGTSTGTVAIGNSAATAINLDALTFSIDSTTASNITVTGAGQDLTLSSVLGSVLVSSTEDAANAIRLHANGGVTETIQLHSDLGTAVNSIDILSDVGGITLTATGLASADAINLNAVAGGVDIDGALQVNIDSAQAAVADSVRIIASAADGGMDLDSGTGGTTIDSTGAVSIEGAAASDFSVSGAGIDLSLVSAGGRVVVNGEEAADDGVRILSAAGGVDLDAALSINITSSENTADAVVLESSAGGLQILASGAAAGEDIVITATGSSVNITSTEAVADAIVLDASNAAAGIDLLTGGGEISISSSGNVSMVPVSATVSSPTSTAVTNGRVFKATFQGFTTAAAGTQAYTITNSELGAGDGIMLTLANRGSNDAQITVNRVNTETAGTIIVNTTNEGAAALNGDIIITGWIID